MILCQLLLGNSRLSYRELAEKLDLSVTAVHNRIQTLIDTGIIRKFNASLSVFALERNFHVLIYGYSKANPISNLREKLETQGSIYWLAVGGGNILYLGAFLRNVSELDGLVRFVKETAEIPEPTVGLTGSPIAADAKTSGTFNHIDTKLCELDYKIIRSLKDDSRKTHLRHSGRAQASQPKPFGARLARMEKKLFLSSFRLNGTLTLQTTS